MSLSLNEGAIVYLIDKEYVVKKLLDYEILLAEDVETGALTSLHIAHLSSKPLSDTMPEPYMDIEKIPQKELDKAEIRFEAIRPLLNINSRRVVESRAQEVGVSTATLYNWLKAYESTGRLSALVIPRTQGGKGKSRLSGEQEAIIKGVIEQFYLVPLKPSARKTWEEIVLRCRRASVEEPSLSSITRRLYKISEQKLLAKRKSKHALRAYQPLLNGSYPDIIKPMHTIQIDHTKVDIMLVDDIYRVELGRPWITLAIDVFSRMISGYYISFESPGYLATGLTICCSVLKKDEIIQKYNLSSKWPVYGLPQIIHTDNAKEFRGVDIEKVCREYNINLQWRPVGRPHFGGHIERLIGTLNQDIHNLEGTTFSNIHHKGEYDSQKAAVMTLSEFEEWLAVLIVDKYHNQKHSGIGMTPLQKYEEGVFGTKDTPPAGLPPIVEDIDRFKINMLPFEERTIQRYGIQIDGITYNSEVLTHWINAKEQDGSKKRFTIRRDPRDISLIYFYDPELNEYFEIPYAVSFSFPSASLWEWRAAKKHLKDIENREYNDYEVFEALERMRQIEQDAKNMTKKHRRSTQRRDDASKAAGTFNRPVDNNSPRRNEGDLNGGDFMFEDIEPFEGIED